MTIEDKDKETLIQISEMAFKNRTSNFCMEDDVGSFHPNGRTSTVYKFDDYFCGYRADHFIIIDGTYEEYENCIFTPAIMFVCNHKGVNIIKYIIFK